MNRNNYPYLGKRERDLETLPNDARSLSRKDSPKLLLSEVVRSPVCRNERIPAEGNSLYSVNRSQTSLRAAKCSNMTKIFSRVNRDVISRHRVSFRSVHHPGREGFFFLDVIG